jgi:geranylgeranyl pyrophosphate synthase
MAVDSAISEVVRVAGEHVPQTLAAVERRLEQLSDDAAPLTEYARGTITAGGKRLRPLLVILAGGAQPSRLDAVVRAGVAVELVHAATLVHDDVLDDAQLRRGQPTVWASAGRLAATCTGDLLFARAIGELAAGGDAAAVRALSEASSALAQGELLQRYDAWNTSVSGERYLLRCELKTARLFEAACRLGIRAGGGDTSSELALGDFGRQLGIAFQMLDDVLDVAGPADRTGKHRGTDLLDGTVTLPLILARRSDPELARLDIRTLRTSEEAERVCDLIAATGALDEVRDHALRLVSQSLGSLPQALVDSQRQAFELLAQTVVKRYR